MLNIGNTLQSSSISAAWSGSDETDLVKKKKKKTTSEFSNSIFEPPPYVLNSSAHISVEPPTCTENTRLMFKTIKKGDVSLH